MGIDKNSPAKDLANMGTKTKRILGAELWVKVLIGLFLGVLVGLGLSYFSPTVGAENTQTIGQWLALPGYLFLAMIQMIVIPLVLSSVFYGIAASQMETVKKVGLRVVLYFIGTTTVAITVGSLLAVLIKPGRYITEMAMANAASGNAPVAPTADAATITNWSREITSILPNNIFDTLAQGDLLRVVIFAAIFGAAVLAMPAARSKPLTDLASSLQEGCMVVVSWVMKLAPLAVFGLLAQVVSSLGMDAVAGMAAYMGTVLLGLISMFCLYLLLVKFVCRVPISTFLRGARPVQLLAFSTSSSAAVMPVTMQAAEKSLGVSPNVARMVVPLGATINMDGTALYQAIAAIFLAQVYGIDLGMHEFGLIMLTTVGASIGAPGTPGVGIVVLASILLSIGVPAEGIAIILGVDRILDMCRTTLNVSGDMVASMLMHKLLGKKLNVEEAAE